MPTLPALLPTVETLRPAAPAGEGVQAGPVSRVPYSEAAAFGGPNVMWSLIRLPPWAPGF